MRVFRFYIGNPPIVDINLIKEELPKYLVLLGPDITISHGFIDCFFVEEGSIPKALEILRVDELNIKYDKDINCDFISCYQDFYK